MELKKPKRLFTFGCSFTGYKWATWANILGYELDCEFYNFGISGAGNSYITNTLTQADCYFNFCSDDLVIVCWTNISREDRWIINKGWLTPGNIYSQSEYDRLFVKKWANDMHFFLDFANIHLVENLLKNKNVPYNFISMCDLHQTSQWESMQERNYEDPISKLSRLYQSTLDNITHNFYTELWKNDIHVKFERDKQQIHKHYCDGHPTPKEHLEFLECALDYKFSYKTVSSVESLQKDWIDFLKYHYSKTKRDTPIHELDKSVEKQLRKNYKLRVSDDLSNTIFH